MSRCFPFPPPGYEKKSTLEDTSLKIEENHKKRKHKEKKGKDKTEKKERKEKERSEGEHKEDKDRKKKKHRDKKDKKKDKQKSPAEKDIVDSSENQNSQKLTPNDKSSDGIQDRKILIELGKRVRNDDKASSSQILHKIPLVEQRKTHLFGKVEENSAGILANVQSHKVQSKVLENGLVENDSCRVERVELGKRFKEDDDANGSQMLHNSTFGEQKKAYVLGKEKENGGGMLANNGQSLEVQSRGLRNGSVGDFNREKQRKFENGSGYMEKVELGKRVRKDDDMNGSQQLYKIIFGEERRANLPGKKEENGGGMLANSQSLKVQSRDWRNGLFGDSNGEKQHKVENGSGQMEKVKLETRVGKVDEANGSQMLHKITFGEQKKAYLLGKEKENGCGVLANGQSLKVQSKQQKVEVSSGQMEKVESGKKVRNNDEATCSKISHKLLEKLGESGGGGMLVNGQSLKVQSRGLEIGSVEIFNEVDQHKVDNGSSRVVKVEKRKKDMEKRTHKNGECNGDGGQKDDRDKKNKAEEKKRKKEKKEKKKETKDKKKDRSKDKIKERQEDGLFVDFSNNKPLEIPNENLESNGILPKSKEFELNGLSHNFGNNKPSDVLKDRHGNLSKGNGIRPSVISRLASSSQNGNGVVENISGKLDEPSRPISISSKPDINNNVANLALRQNGNGIVEKVNGKLVEPSRPVSISSRPNVNNNVANLASSTREVRQNGNGVLEKANEKLVEPSRPISSSSKPNINNNVASNGHVSSNVDKKTEPCEIRQRSTRPPPIINKVVIDEGADVNHKMDNKVPMMSGILVDKDNLAKLPSVSMKVKEKIGKRVKHPHPDLKYLSQIINVPKVENLQFDDQEWLFGCMDSRSKRAKLNSTEIEQTKLVWAKSIHIESADVTALPYVIPY